MISLISSTICAVAVVATASLANAGSGVIDASAFSGERTIVFTDTFECENHIYGLVVKNDEWSFGFSGEGSVLLDTKIVEDSWSLRGAPEHEYEFIRKTYHDKDFAHLKEDSPEYAKLLNEAQEKDATHKREVLAALAEEHRRAGLKADPETERIVYYFSGKSKMRVIETLQGDLNPGDMIEVTWKHVQRRTSCPPVIPYKGKCGWIFDSRLQKGAKTDLGHGFFSLEEAKKAKVKHDRNAHQPATALDSNSEGNETPKTEAEGRSQ